MRPEELQIGDWVLWKNKPVQIAQISGIKYSFGHIDVLLAHCNDDNLLESHDIKSIEPIPITHEILKENGFKKKDVFDGWVHYESFPLIDFVLHEDDEGYYIDLMDARIKYIHQLQQAMRLCGINKEITLN